MTYVLLNDYLQNGHSHKILIHLVFSGYDHGNRGSLAERRLTMDNMFGRLIRLIVTVPSRMLGPLCDLAEKLVSSRGDEWFEFLKHMLREGPTKTAKKVKTYFRLLFTFTLGATNGTDTLETARKVFKACLYPDFERCGIVFSSIAPETELFADELVENGKFSDFLGNTAEELEKRRLFGSQFLKLCRDHPDKIRGRVYANFFVFTKGDEVVAEDLSNVFVAQVFVNEGGKPRVGLRHISCDHVWDGDLGIRAFSPQL